MNNPLRRFDPVLIYLLLEGVSALLFGVVVTIYVVFYARTVGLSTLQIVLFGTVFETTIFLFEIPTGIVADLYSRRLSVILGILLTGAAYVAEGIVPTFAVVLAAEVITGIGATFLSGATEAWIADEIGADRVGAVYVRGAQVKQIAAIAGIVISVILASVALTIPFIAAGAVFLLLAIFLIVAMPEAGFTPTPRSQRATWRSLTSTLRDGVRLIRLRPLLLFMLAYTFIFAFHAEGFDHLWQKHVLDDFTLPALGSLDSVVWFGVFSLGANLLGLALSEIVRRRVDLRDGRVAARALLLITALQPLGILIFSLTGNFAAALIAFWGIMALRGAGEPVGRAWLNGSLEPSSRATMFSVASQTGALGEIVGGPPVGWIGQAFSVRAALASTAAILALTVPLLAAALRKSPTAAGASNTGIEHLRG